MVWLAPLGALLGISLPAIAALYFLKLRRQEQVVSSTMLWTDVARDLTANAPWQRLKPNVLLLLQLLVALLLTLALTRPALPSGATIHGNLVLLLDGSASMQATDVAPSRFEVARQRALGYVDGMSASDSMTIVLVGAQPRILAFATSDRAQLRSVLQAAQPTNGGVDMQDALSLAATLAHRPDSTVIVISDGGFTLPGGQPAIAAPVVNIGVGSTSTDNAGIVAMSSRALGDGSGRSELYLRVENASAHTRSLVLTVDVDGQLIDARTLSLPAHAQTSIIENNVPAGGRIAHAHLGPADSLAADNDAWAVIQASAPTRVLLVTPGNVFLERALSLLPGLIVDRQTPAQYSGAQSYDVTIFDRYLPATLPASNILAIDPPRTSALGVVSGTLSQPAPSIPSLDDPLLRYANLSSLRVLTATRLVAPSWATIPVGSAHGPLLYYGRNGAQRAVVLAFDVHASNLPLLVAFPIIVANSLSYLAPVSQQDVLLPLTPGSPLPDNIQPGASSVRVTLPDGQTRALAPTEGALVGVETNALGAYRVRQTAGNVTLADDWFAVDVANPQETELAARPFAIAGQVGAVGQARRNDADLWRWLAGAAILLVMAEWWWYHRFA